MLDRTVRRLIDPFLEIPAAFLAARRIPANAITVAGFLLGMLSCVAIVQKSFEIALMLILANRFADGIDGMVARRTQASDTGGFLDIVLDIAFYAGVPFSFALADPGVRLPACFLLYSFMGTTGSFLAYAAISAKRGVTADRDGRKSFFYSVGLMEGTETVIFFILFCVFPEHFSPLAWTFGVLCCLTTLIRLTVGIVEFRQP
jgi:phosphatidylserine synthase